MAVLVGFTPTAEGRAAVRRALLECHLRGARLVVINSAQIFGQSSASSSVGDPAEVEVLSACAELNVSQPDLEIRRFANSYEPADDVLAVAEETGAELIVIGLRRRSGSGKLILGGSAQRILLDASCPVLAVKADQRMTGPGVSGDFSSVTVSSRESK